MNTASQQPDNPADLQSGPSASATTGGPADDNEILAPTGQVARTPGFRFLAHLVKHGKRLVINGQEVPASAEAVWSRITEKDRQNYDTAASAFADEAIAAVVERKNRKVAESNEELNRATREIARLEEAFLIIAKAVGPAAYDREGNPGRIWRIVQAATDELATLKEYRTSINWLIGELAGEKKGRPAAESNGRASAASVMARVRGLVRELESEVEDYLRSLKRTQEHARNLENQAGEFSKNKAAREARVDQQARMLVDTTYKLAEANREIGILRAQLEQHRKPGVASPSDTEYFLPTPKPKRQRKPKSPTVEDA